MRIELVEYFVTTARLGSVTKAAIALNKRRSTVGMGISVLEDELGVQLFKRTGNSLALSSMGESILDDCVRLLSVHSGIVQRCLINEEIEHTEIRIGRDDALSEAFWRQVILQLRRHYPHLHLSMRFAASDELPDLIHQQQLDIAFAMVESLHEQPDGLYRKILGHIPMCMMITAAHPLADLKQVTDNDLQSITQVSYMDSMNRERFHLEYLGSERIALSSFELVRDAIRDGLGWGFVPRPLLQLEQLGVTELALINHGFSQIEYPYLVYRRAPEMEVAEGRQKVITEVNRIVAQAIRQISTILV